jgi:hypothetical protein
VREWEPSDGHPIPTLLLLATEPEDARRGNEQALERFRLAVDGAPTR